ncbi:MAG TPA: carbohydrate ABC transporter permease [Actinopolymorphaceae bacterium]|jgi:multiple sugar transport system permease protein
MATVTERPKAPEATRPVVKRSTFHPRIGARLTLIAMSVVFLVPLYWMVATSLKSPAELAQAVPSWLPQDWLWSNYVEAFQAFPFGRYFVNSVLITVLSVIGSVVASVIVAYGFACIEWRGRDKVFYIVIATMFLPGTITLIPTFDLFAWLGMVNTWFPLILPHFLAGGFFVFLLRQFLLQIPKDLLDAARVDGASEWWLLWRVAAPMSKPALAVVAIFTAVGSWNDFMGPLIYVSDVNLQPLAIGLQQLRQVQPDKITTNLLMAASTMVVIPVVVMFFAFQRYFIRGITIGAIR